MNDSQQCNTYYHTNPLKEDIELKSLLKELESPNRITSKQQFEQWRNSFLLRFIEFLDVNSTTCAEQAYWKFSDTMSTFVRVINKLNTYIDTGAITNTYCSVKARQCLQEVNRTITIVIDEIDTLIPGTMAMEKIVGYTKFHIGAVLVRDGFREYARMSLCADVIEIMTIQQNSVIKHVADKLILLNMNTYLCKMNVFCDVMADLGLLSALMKCREYITADDDEEHIIPISPSKKEKDPIIATTKRANNNNENSSDTYPTFDLSSSITLLDRSNTILDHNNCSSNNNINNDNDDDQVNNRSLVLFQTPNSSPPTFDPETSITIMESSLTILDLATATSSDSNVVIQREVLPNEIQERTPAPYGYVAASPKQQRQQQTGTMVVQQQQQPSKGFQPRESAPYGMSSSSNSKMDERPVQQKQQPDIVKEREPAPYGFVAPSKKSKGDPTKTSSSSSSSSSSLPTEFQPREPAPYGSSSKSELVTPPEIVKEREPAPYGYVAPPKKNTSNTTTVPPPPSSSSSSSLPTEFQPRDPAPYGGFKSDLPPPKDIQKKSPAPYGNVTQQAPTKKNEVDPTPKATKVATPDKKASTSKKPPIIQKQRSISKDVSTEGKPNPTAEVPAPSSSSKPTPGDGNRVRWNPVDYYRNNKNSKATIQDNDDDAKIQKEKKNDGGKQNEKEKEVLPEKKGIRSFFQRKSKQAEGIDTDKPMKNTPKEKPTKNEVSSPMDDDDDSIQLNNGDNNDDDDEDKVDTDPPRRRPKWSLNDFYQNTKNRLRTKKEKESPNDKSMKDIAATEEATTTTTTTTTANSINNESISTINNVPVQESSINEGNVRSKVPIEDISEDDVSESSTMVSDHNDEPPIRQVDNAPKHPTENNNVNTKKNEKPDTKQKPQKTTKKQPDKSSNIKSEPEKTTSKQPNSKSNQPDESNNDGSKPNEKRSKETGKKVQQSKKSDVNEKEIKEPQSDKKVTKTTKSKKEPNQTENPNEDGVKHNETPTKESKKEKKVTKKANTENEETKKPTAPIEKSNKTPKKVEKPANPIEKASNTAKTQENESKKQSKPIVSNNSQSTNEPPNVTQREVNATERPMEADKQSTKKVKPASTSNNSDNPKRTKSTLKDETALDSGKGTLPTTKKVSTKTKNDVEDGQSPRAGGLPADDLNSKLKPSKPVKKPSKKEKVTTKAQPSEKKNLFGKRKEKVKSKAEESAVQSDEQNGVSQDPGQVWDGRAMEKKANGRGNEPLAICAAPPEDENDLTGNGGGLLMICAAEPENDGIRVNGTDGEDDGIRVNGTGGELLMICAEEPEAEENSSNDACGELLMICAAEPENDDADENDEDSLSADDVSESETIVSDDEENDDEEVGSATGSDPSPHSIDNDDMKESEKSLLHASEDNVSTPTLIKQPTELSNKSIATSTNYVKSDTVASQPRITPEADNGSMNNAPPKKETKVLTDDERRKCYMWYDRMGRPNRDRMKQRVLAMADCDITVEDVDALPWMCRGAMINQSELNKLIMKG